MGREPKKQTLLNEAPAIISFQIENGKFIKKNDKFIVSFGRYKVNYIIDNKTVTRPFCLVKSRTNKMANYCFILFLSSILI